MIGIAFEQIGQERSVQLTNGAAEATKDGSAEDLEIVINQIEEIILRATEGVQAEKEVTFSSMAYLVPSSTAVADTWGGRGSAIAPPPSMLARAKMFLFKKIEAMFKSNSFYWNNSFGSQYLAKLSCCLKYCLLSQIRCHVKFRRVTTIAVLCMNYFALSQISRDISFCKITCFYTLRFINFEKM